MIGSGRGPVAAECGPTGHNFGMAGQGRAECGPTFRKAGQAGQGSQGRAGQGKAGRARQRSAGQGRPGQGRGGQRQGRDTQDTRVTAPGLLGLLRCDCRASSGASLADASARSLLLFAAPAARSSLGNLESPIHHSENPHPLTYGLEPNLKSSKPEPCRKGPKTRCPQ